MITEVPIKSGAKPIRLHMRMHGWGWKKATDPDDVVHFLSGTGPYKQAASHARITATWNGAFLEFYVFYQDPLPGEAPRTWGWKKVTDPDDVMAFLNGTGPYKSPVADAKICLVWRDTYLEFYVFYHTT
jgi:hypothetical protein